MVPFFATGRAGHSPEPEEFSLPATLVETFQVSDVPQRGSLAQAHVGVVGGRVAVGGLNGLFIAGERHRRVRAVWGIAELSDGGAVVSSPPNLLFLDKSARVVREVQVEGSVCGVDGEVVLVVCGDASPKTVMLNAKGKALWTSVISPWRACVYGTVTVMATTGGEVVCLRTATGELDWKVELDKGDEVRGLACSEQSVVCVTRGEIRLLRRHDGTTIRRQAFGRAYPRLVRVTARTVYSLAGEDLEIVSLSSLSVKSVSLAKYRAKHVFGNSRAFVVSDSALVLVDGDDVFGVARSGRRSLFWKAEPPGFVANWSSLRVWGGRLFVPDFSRGQVRVYAGRGAMGTCG